MRNRVGRNFFPTVVQQRILGFEEGAAGLTWGNRRRAAGLMSRTSMKRFCANAGSGSSAANNGHTDIAVAEVAACRRSSVPANAARWPRSWSFKRNAVPNASSTLNRGTHVATLLEPHVVVGADAGELSDLLPPKPLHAPAPRIGQPHVTGRQTFPARAKKLGKRLLRGHEPHLT
ncbi:hypothetical protein R3Q16_31925 [Rhodococcus globerulus]|uniref:Transposase n=1 Tax=Rhodococcus globerulus TaxID=33008 RepID=A0ABU4C430_RHOGO|nr:hypothetical protein [Rhodococcus globerulus]MDV6271232.1 hypothetical protein [Rhodococcus globerulus]